MTGLGPAPMGPSATVGQGLVEAGMVESKITAIALVFPANGDSMLVQAAGDLGIGITLPLHSIDDISFVHGKMVVRHREHSVV